MAYADFQPDISVVLAVRNGAPTVGACLDSLLAQEYPNQKLEILVVDNGSTDRTASVLARYHRKIGVLRTERRGASAARNCGIAAARGEAIAFTDADCVADPSWLRHIVEPLADAQVGIAGGPIVSRRPCNAVEAFGDYVHDQSLAINEYTPPYVASGNWCSRRRIFTDVGLFDEELLRGQDAELSWRIFAAGFRLEHVPTAIVYHRNERTLGGLLREGFTHGKASILVHRLHHELVRQTGHPRIYWQSYRDIGNRLVRSVTGPDRAFSACYVVFNVGKKLGKIAGSIRYRYRDL
jgi:glycosyltransferase involved in cell wall biosynthesis